MLYIYAFGRWKSGDQHSTPSFPIQVKWSGDINGQATRMLVQYNNHYGYEYWTLVRRQIVGTDPEYQPDGHLFPVASLAKHFSLF